jgi:hypothetical protein
MEKNTLPKRAFPHGGDTHYAYGTPCAGSLICSDDDKHRTARIMTIIERKSNVTLFIDTIFHQKYENLTMA